MASARASVSASPLSTRALRSGSSRISSSLRSKASFSQPRTCGPRTTSSGTSWKMVRWLGGTSGRARPLTSSGTSRDVVSWLGAKLNTPPSTSRISTPYSPSTRRVVAKSCRGDSGWVSLRVTRSLVSRRPGDMMKDMASSSPKTALMKATNGTSWKLTWMGSPVRSWPSRSAIPSATVRWMTTPGTRAVRVAISASSGTGSACASVAAAGGALGARIGSGRGSMRNAGHAAMSSGRRSATQGRRGRVLIATPRPRPRRGAPCALRGTARARRGRGPRAPPPRGEAGTGSALPRVPLRPRA